MIIELNAYMKKEEDKGFQRTLLRLQKMILIRYELRTELISFSDSSSESNKINSYKEPLLKPYEQNSSLKIIKILITTKQPVTLGQDTYFPLFYNNRLLYALKVNPSLHLSQNERSDLSALIEVTLQSFLNAQQKVENQNENLKNLSLNYIDEKKIIPLVSYIKKTNIKSIHLYQRNLHSNLKLPSVFFLQTLTNQDNCRLASEIHERSESIAIIRYSDLNSESKQSLLNGQPLGSLTIFIPELNNLSLLEQSQLAHYIQQPLNSETRFIISSLHSFKHLLELGKGCSNLLSNYRETFLYLNKPFSLYKTQGLLDLFFYQFQKKNSSV